MDISIQTEAVVQHSLFENWLFAFAYVGKFTLANGCRTMQFKEFKKFGSNSYWPPEMVNGHMQYFRESKIVDSQYPELGKVKYWDIIVPGVELKDAAWSYIEPSTDYEAVKGYIAFRAAMKGDSGVGLQPTGELDGVTIDESWFG